MNTNTGQAGNQNHHVDLIIVVLSVIFAVHPKVQPRDQDQIGSYDEDHEDNGAENVYGSTFSSNEEIEQLRLRNFLAFHDLILLLLFLN